MGEVKSSLNEREHLKLAEITRGKVSRVMCAYYAGFFDGEGCIRLSYSRGSRKSLRLKNIANDKRYYHMQVNIGQTDKATLQQIHDYFGGSLTLSHPKKGNPVWRWVACGKNANNFLRDTISFLQLKKGRAKLALYYYTQRLRLNDDEKETIKQKISSLNGNKAHHPQRLNEMDSKQSSLDETIV